jgi:nitrogen regulatory protein P-II 1
MRKIEATIRPYKLDEVKDCLSEAGVQGITVSEVKGYGALKGTSHYRGVRYVVDLHPMVKLEIVVPDAQVADLVRNIEKAARTGRVGDGRIFVTPVLDAVRIRTGEHGSSTIELSTTPREDDLAQAPQSHPRHIGRRVSSVVKDRHPLPDAGTEVVAR